MANDEYQLPHFISSEQEPLSTEFVEVPANIPETFRGGKYFEAKKKAAEIQQWRLAADETLIPRRLTQRVFDGLVQKIGFSVDRDKPLTERLINAEGDIGGLLFPLNEGVLTQRFWLDMPHAAGADDWFYECTDLKGPMSAHYIVTDEGVEKRSNGHTVPLVRANKYDEVEVLINKISEYHQETKQFYGVRSDYDLAA